jgi:hypothetical protein
MTDRLIPGVPRLAQFIGDESYLTCYVGSLHAALHGMDRPRPYHDLLGLSGAGNRLSWRPGTWFPGNVDLATCEEPPFAPHQRVLTALGLRAEVRGCRDFPGLTPPFVDEETARQEIVESLDRDLPVIALGIIGPPESCVVLGYEEDGERLIGWNYFQADEGLDAERPFVTANWFAGLTGYLLLAEEADAPGRRASALAALRAVVDHAHRGEVRGARVGLAAWTAMLDQVEHDDFSTCATLLPRDKQPEEDAFSATVQGRLYVYCDALCQVHERQVVLPYYAALAIEFREWAPYLGPAIELWGECASYGGFVWKHLTMDEAGYERFRTPEVRAILAAEGRRCAELDRRAVAHIEDLLAAEPN